MEEYIDLDESAMNAAVAHDLALYGISLEGPHNLGQRLMVREARAPYGAARCFEDLIVSQRARQLTAAIYKATGENPMAKDYGLKDQIRRAVVSIMSNMAEGHERTGAREYLRSVSHCNGSCGELRSQLYICLDVGYLTAEQFEKLALQAREVGFLLYKLEIALKASLERHEEKN